MLMAIFKTVMALLGAALVMAAWSEFLFFNEDVADALNRAIGQSPAAALNFIGEIALFYAIPALFLLGLMACFGSAGPARIMLLGALTGYAIEGAVVPAVYEAVPLSYLWTSVAWHGPVTVGLGLFWLPHVFANASLGRMLGIVCLLGLGWGLWMPWTWTSPDTAPLASEAFLAFALTTTGIMIVGYSLLASARWPKINISRGIAVACILPTLVLLVLQGIQVPIPAIGLAVILATLVALLAHLKLRESETAQLKWGNLIALVGMPLIATVVYAIQLEYGTPLPADDLIALTFLGGLVVWLWGLWRGLRRA